MAENKVSPQELFQFLLNIIFEFLSQIMETAMGVSSATNTYPKLQFENMETWVGSGLDCSYMYVKLSEQHL